MGFIGKADPIIMQVYSEPLQRFRLAARGHGTVQPPERERARIETYFDPLPIWYEPFEGAAIDTEAFPMHAITQRPMHMYHSWGSQNAWLRQITGQNRLFMHRDTAKPLGIVDDDWVWLVSHHNRIRVQVRLVTGVNPHTVWTWNAIGKRRGAWRLAENAPESNAGFILNHIISELLPERDDGYRYANADPVTGQAAWYDLRVRVERATAAEAGETAPTFPTVAAPDGLPRPPDILRYGASFRRRHEDVEQ